VSLGFGKESGGKEEIRKGGKKERKELGRRDDRL
jgi:hypothetical protein